jgi:hypothetical protein
MLGKMLSSVHNQGWGHYASILALSPSSYHAIFYLNKDFILTIQGERQSNWILCSKILCI